MGKIKTRGFNDFRQGFIALEQGVQGFCNPHLATKTINSVRTIRGLGKFSGDPYYEPLARFMIITNSKESNPSPRHFQPS